MVFTASTVLSPPPSGAVENGDVVGAAPPWAAYVTTTNRFLFQQTFESSCSGTIIDNGWVLTAAHCIYDDNGVLTKKSKFKVVLGRDDLNASWRGGQWSVLQAIPHPNYVYGQGSEFDIALLQLDGSLPATAMPLPLAPRGWTLPDDAHPTAWGYGWIAETYPKRDLDKNIYDNPRGDTSQYLRTTKPNSYTHDSSCDSPTHWCLERTGDSGVLHGDSGGPWTMGVEHPYVVGVQSHSAGPQRTSNTTVRWRYAGASKASADDIFGWIDSTVGLVEANAGTIYRNAETGEAFLAGDDGFVTHIPTGGDYLCFEAQGAPVTNLPPFLVAMLPKTDGAAICNPGNGGSNDVVLYAFEEEGGDSATVAAILTEAGYDVEIVTTLPDDLSSIGQLWVFTTYRAVDPGIVTRIEEYVEDGGSLYINSEHACCPDANRSVEEILNQVTVGGPIQVVTDCASPCSFPAPNAFNPGAVGGIGNTPNADVIISTNAAGWYAPIENDNILMTASSGLVTGVVWDSNELVGGAGRLVAIADSNWTDQWWIVNLSQVAAVQNIAHFLSRQ
jgi:hypothetical protein